MRHIAAYLLLQIGGNASPSAEDVKKVLAAVGIEADDERLEKLISELADKDINTVSTNPLSVHSGNLLFPEFAVRHANLFYPSIPAVDQRGLR